VNFLLETRFCIDDFFRSVFRLLFFFGFFNPFDYGPQLFADGSPERLLLIFRSFFPCSGTSGQKPSVIADTFFTKISAIFFILFFLGLAFGLCHRSSWLGKFPYQLAQSNASLTQSFCLSSGFFKNV
jgi:hypothetical protein